MPLLPWSTPWGPLGRMGRPPLLPELVWRLYLSTHNGALSGTPGPLGTLSPGLGILKCPLGSRTCFSAGCWGGSPPSHCPTPGGKKGGEGAGRPSRLQAGGGGGSVEEAGRAQPMVRPKPHRNLFLRWLRKAQRDSVSGRGGSFFSSVAPTIQLLFTEPLKRKLALGRSSW